MGRNDKNQEPSSTEVSFTTPYDDLIPNLDDSEAQFYLDAIRIYLGLCEGTVSMEVALKATDVLKQNPEYTAYPTNPTTISINSRYKTKILENLRTLNKFNLFTKSSIKSAYNFAFLMEEVSVNNSDLSLLAILAKDPTISLVDASKHLDVTPRTVARSLKRLDELNQLRVTSFVDFTAFNLQSVMLFFTVQDGLDWNLIERGFTNFPFTKSILKTTMTDVGYVTFLYPNYEETKKAFHRSLKRVAKTLFEYSSIHYQEGSGATSNVELYNNEKWELPLHLEDMLDDSREPDVENYPPLLYCSGVRPELKYDDYIIVSQMQTRIREPPSKISEGLQLQGYDYDSKLVSLVSRKIQKRNIVLPYLVYALPGISSNFCFEVVCNENVRSRIIEVIGRFPWTIYYLSTRGIIVWTMTPGEHQVEYYQLFRALEKKPGVQSVNPIMTISYRGSKSMFDLTRNLSYDDGRWSVTDEDVELDSYFEF